MFFLIFISPNIEKFKIVPIYAIYLQLSSDTGLIEMSHRVTILIESLFLTRITSPFAPLNALLRELTPLEGTFL